MVLMFSPLGQPTEVAPSMIKTYLDFRGYTYEDPHLLKVNPNSLRQIIEMEEKPDSEPKHKDGNDDQDDKLALFNKSSKQQIMDLPGIGPKIAEKIINDRPIESWHQLKELSDRVDWDEIKDEIEF